MINHGIKDKAVCNEIIGKLQKDIMNFDNLMNKNLQLIKEELEELSLANNTELMEGIKKSEEDFKAGRMTICKTEKDIDSFFDSL